MACEEAQYELLCRGRDFHNRPVRKRELFALGSAIYEITAWKRPYQDKDNAEIAKLYERGEFPRVAGILVGDGILGCWMEKYETADNVVLPLQKVLAIEMGHSNGAP